MGKRGYYPLIKDATLLIHRFSLQGYSAPIDNSHSTIILLVNNMLYRNLLWILSIASFLNIFVAIPRVQSNCAGGLFPLEEVQSKMQQHWQNLQRQETYPWGETKVYESLQDDIITLASSFDQLPGSEKQAVLNLLQLSSQNYPHKVYTHDGRLLSSAYDGCTRDHLLTEKARYSWYYNDIGRSLPSDTPREALRNTGNPSWRKVNVLITEAQEQPIRHLFWERMGYNQADKGMWIAWVPEQGYFEINVPNNYDIKELDEFWQLAPNNNRYVVVSSDGSFREDINWILNRDKI